jgi:hypothetical protein
MVYKTENEDKHPEQRMKQLTFFYIKFNGIDVTKPKNHLVKVRKKRSTAGTHRKADNMLKKHVWNITNILSIENLSIKRQVSGFL